MTRKAGIGNDEKHLTSHRLPSGNVEWLPMCQQVLHGNGEWPPMRRRLPRGSGERQALALTDRAGGAGPASGQQGGVLGAVALGEAGHERAAGFHLQVLGAGVGQGGAGQLVGHTLAAQGLGHEGLVEVDNAGGGAGVGQLGAGHGAGGGELLVDGAGPNGYVEAE